MVTTSISNQNVKIQWTEPTINFKPVTAYKIVIRTVSNTW